MPLASGRVRHLALLQAVEQGRITGSFGYGFER